MPTFEEYRAAPLEVRLERLRRTPAELDASVPWRIGGAIGHPLDPDRWAEERQYRRSDGRAALQALMRRRAQVLALLDSLTPADWQRGGSHLKRGRQTLAHWVASLAQHDDNHLEQLRRALAGQP